MSYGKLLSVRTTGGVQIALCSVHCGEVVPCVAKHGRSSQGWEWAGRSLNPSKVRSGGGSGIVNVIINSETNVTLSLSLLLCLIVCNEDAVSLTAASTSSSGK